MRVYSSLQRASITSDDRTRNCSRLRLSMAFLILVASAVTLGVLATKSVPVRADAQGPSLAVPPVDDPTHPVVTQRLYCGLWRTDGAFEATINLKNALVIGGLRVTPILFMADGTEYPLPSVVLQSAGISSIDINSALAAAPPTIASHVSEYGSAALRFDWPWRSAITGDIVSRNVPKA
jgi:hypothetical protein